VRDYGYHQHRCSTQPPPHQKEPIMPANASTISLDVRNFPSNGSGGYTDIEASNKAIYSYKYSGGTGDGGHVTFTGRGYGEFVVRLQSDPRYTIDHVDFSNDINRQHAWAKDTSTAGRVQNQNNAMQTADYKVTVKDSIANCTVLCDPKIINQ
jgi:hypothetical protein